MINITISIPEEVLSDARKQALADNTSVNAVVVNFLKQYAGRRRAVKKYDNLMKRLEHVNAGRKFTRDEMNE